MATVLSSWFDEDFKSYFSYSTSSTNTTYSITVTEAGVYQDCTWSEYNWKTELSATSNSTTTGSVGVTYWNKGYHALITADKTYTYARTTYAYTVTVSAKSTQVATGRNATASQSFTVPALPSYTVSYNANGGSGAPSAQTKWYGITLTLSSTKPTRSGYTFVGWGVSTTDTDVNYAAGGSFTANQNFTLYAIWKKTITLTYNANSGSDAPSAQSATVYNATTSNTFTVSSTKPTRTGYNFLGWSTSSSATSASYVAGDKITLSSSGTLYAVWKLITYTVSYDANEGTNPPSAQTKTYGTDLVLSSTSPSRFGYNFLGWATSADATVAEYSAGGVYKTNANLSLYAVWERAIFTVKYDANGGTNAPASQEKVYESDLILTSDEPTRKYHAFKGWAESQTATVPTYLAGGTYSSNVDVTLYAVWEVTYLIPRITGVSIVRCDGDGNPQDDGTYALVKFNWATDEDVTSIRIYWKKSTDVAYVDNIGVAATGRGGSVSQVVGGGAISEDSAYNFTISVADSTDSNTATQSIGNTQFPIDLLSGGKGVTIGEPAKEEGLIVKFVSKFKSMVNVLTNFTFRTNDKGEDEIADSDGLSVLIPKTSSGNTTLGYGGYANESKATNIYGNLVQVYAKKGMSIGKVANYIEELGERLEVHWKSKFYKDVEVDGTAKLNNVEVGGNLTVNGAIQPKQITANTNLNDITEAGIYYCPLNVDVETLLNCPAKRAFSMEVLRTTNADNGVTQIIRPYHPNDNGEYVRKMYYSEIGAWEKRLGKVQIQYQESSFTSKTEWFYGGIEITIPAGCIYGINAQAIYSNAKPDAIAIAYNSTSNASIMSYCDDGSNWFYQPQICDTGFTASGSINRYIWTKYSGAGTSNRVTAYWWYIPFTDF